MKIDIETLRQTKGIGSKTLERIIEQHNINENIKSFKSEYIPSDKYEIYKDINLWQGDCLELMNHIPDKSIDMILCDLPYGTTQNVWDSVLPLDIIWKHYNRILKDSGKIILTASGGFTHQLIKSIPLRYKWYDIIWNKKSTTGFLNSNRQPLRQHEDVLVIYKNQGIYNPIMEIRGKVRSKGSYNKKQGNGDMCYGVFKNIESYNNEYFPTSIITISNASQKDKIHPTQKPIELGEYLIKTYTNEGMLVLDNTMGSGSTGVACKNTNRKFIGIELDEGYFEVAKKRIRNIE